MQCAWYELPFGSLQVRYEGDLLFGLKIRGDKQPEEGIRSPFSERVEAEVREYLAGERRTFDIPYLLQGTPFQMKVWHALETIPYGEVKTYGEIAGQIGRPGAARAVGGACHCNPIGVVVPCHRVIGTGGKLTGYAGGVQVKEILLAVEENCRLK